MLPPVLEVYVVWHPDDANGRQVADSVIDHFHGTAFSGLIGGAVEVFIRSDSWTDPGAAPRPFPFSDVSTDRADVADITAVVPVIGRGLGKAVERGESWADFIAGAVAAAARTDINVSLIPVRLRGAPAAGALASMLSEFQAITRESDQDDEALCRDLTQAIAQNADPEGGRLRVFVSHTKHAGHGREEILEGLIERVRRTIADTRLDDFFDASELQPGEHWKLALDQSSRTSALLAVRTELYASREWCQREVLEAKRAGMPVVTLEAIAGVEERGSFLMDHMPRVAGHPHQTEGSPDILLALAQLVDECLKRILWRRQRKLAATGDIPEVHWWAPHAPEPTTLIDWLKHRPEADRQDQSCLILHPDPPLGPNETDVLRDLAALCGIANGFEVLTPRGLAARG